MVAQAAAHRLIARKPLRGGNDEVGKTVDSHCGLAMMRLGRNDGFTKQMHMTWVEDAAQYEDKQYLQRGHQ